MIVEWEGEQRFRAQAEANSQVLDGERSAGLSPTDTLLAALAACMGIDIVDILQKGRLELTGCRIHVSGIRREEPPRRFTAIDMAVEVEGLRLDHRKVERAVELSRTKYCSVWSSLAPDIDLTIEARVADQE